MASRQLLLLCLLVCAASAVFAKKGYHHDKDEDFYHDEYSKDYDSKAYDGYEYKEHEDYDDYKGYYGPPPPCDNPHKWPPEWKEYLCLNLASGTPKKYKHKTCSSTITNNQVCFQWKNSKWSCTFNVSQPGKVCRPRMGDCDEADKCVAGSIKCPDTVTPNNTNCPNPVEVPVCYTSTQKCDGVSRRCPVHKVKTGTPCDPEGVYEEALDEYGKVALLGYYDGKKAKEHGWSVCNRCYHGKCRPFKYEWWKTTKTPKKDYDYEYKGAYGKDGKYKDKDYYGEEEKEEYYSEEEEDDYYPTKMMASLQSVDKNGEYEPTIYCHNPYKKDGYKSYGDDDEYEYTGKKGYKGKKSYDEDEYEYKGKGKKSYDDEYEKGRRN